MRRSILYISSIAVLSALAVSVLSGNRIKSHQSYPLQVVNRTQSFSVIKAERGQDDFSFTLKNDSEKTITAVSISPIKGYKIIDEHLFGEIADIGIAPDAVYSKTYSLIGSDYTDTLEIKAIIFDDGSSEGDPTEVREIEDSRVGTQVQMRRAVKELEKFLATGSVHTFAFKQDLEKALDSPDDDTLKTLAELKPSRRYTKKSLTRDLRSGLNNGRQRVLGRISDLEASGLDNPMLYMKEAYEKILRRCPK